MNFDLAIAQTQIEIAKLCLLLQAEEGEVIKTPIVDQFGNKRDVYRKKGQFHPDPNGNGSKEDNSMVQQSGEQKKTVKSLSQSIGMEVDSFDAEIKKLPDDIKVPAKDISKQFKNLFAELSSNKLPKFLTEPFASAQSWGESMLDKTGVVDKPFLENLSNKVRGVVSPENLEKAGKAIRKSLEAAAAMTLAVASIVAITASVGTGFVALGLVSSAAILPVAAFMLMMDRGRTPLHIYEAIDKDVEDFLAKRKEAKEKQQGDDKEAAAREQERVNFEKDLKEYITHVAEFEPKTKDLEETSRKQIKLMVENHDASMIDLLLDENQKFLEWHEETTEQGNLLLKKATDLAEIAKSHNESFEFPEATKQAMERLSESSADYADVVKAYTEKLSTSKKEYLDWVENVRKGR